jgi:hypothetical protein
MEEEAMRVSYLAYLAMRERDRRERQRVTDRKRRSSSAAESAAHR